MKPNSKKPADGSRRPEERRGKPLAKMAVLPVFFDLNGRKAVVLGETDAAEWKTDLLTAAGAEVYRIPGTSIWDVRDLEGAAICIADAPDDDRAAELAEIARVAGVPVNIIDRPAFCDFSFGAIVNRSPVVVGISTAGSAPVLGQAIRRRIETLLPQGIARWAKAAGAMREPVQAVISAASQRRLFWRDLAERAFAEPDHPEPETAMDPKGASFPGSGSAGKVTLVGAGPGDSELLTLKAVRALQSADVILYDDLVSDEVLELARREAKRLLVGKRGNRPSCRQDEINELMVKLAHQGKQVVRLKSGDPMIFGRAGEEIADLRRHGIRFDVVPGISSAIAAASALGVSLTHRDYARSVRFVTGHGRDGGLPGDLDWQGLADPATTLMIYMGGRTASLLAGRLIGQGLDANTPAVIMSDVSRRGETRRLTTLGALQASPPDIGDAPVLIGVGSVFANEAVEMPDADLEAFAAIG